ncbi:MAG: hypothetical protein HYS22_03310 [Deltaproteobacteria bacterium]|nr:hypothetical protein [Deltaproteobacteria bacterium]
MGCESVDNRWHTVCNWAPQIGTAAVTFAEAARSRWFYRDYFIHHRGVSVHIPRPGITVVPGSRQDFLPPEHPVFHRGTVEGMAYYPRALWRNAAHYGVRGAGLGLDLFFGQQAASRLVHGDSKIEGTVFSDGFLMAQGAVGAMAVIGPSRLSRASAAQTWVPLFGVLGLMASGRDIRTVIEYEDWDSEQARMTASHLLLLGLNYLMGVGFREGTARALGKDRRNLQNASAGQVEGRWTVRTVSLARKEEKDWLPHLVDPHHVTRGPIRTSETLLAVEDVNRQGIVGYAGLVTIHRPQRPGAIPQVTFVMEKDFQALGILPRLRTHLLRDPTYGPMLRRGWDSHVATPFLQREAYDRSLTGTGMRRSAWFEAHYWEGDVSGQTVLMNRAWGIFRPDHRFRPPWVAGRDTVGQGGARYLSGTFRNLRDTVGDTAALYRKIRNTPLAYFGNTGHPQLQGSRWWRRARWSERPGATNATPMEPLPAYIDRSPGAGDAHSMPTRDYLKAIAGRERGSVF